MSLDTKKRIAALTLAACVVWPPVHYALAALYDFDPWNFFGWAMYAVPDSRVDLRVAVIEEARARVVELSPGLREQARAYAERRSALGRLAPPDRLAEAVLAEWPEVDAVVIGIRKLVLDPGTGRVEPRDEVQLRYDR